MKRGFTLIELLAVIVVLAIIALIVTPVISKIIASAKQRSSVTSAQNYVDSINNSYALSMIDSNYEYLKEKEVLESGFDDNELAEVQISGKKPSYIKIEYDKSKNRVKEGKFCVDGTSVDYINGVATKSENDYCHKEITPGLYDKDNNLIVSWDSLINDYGMDTDFIHTEGVLYEYHEGHGWKNTRNSNNPYLDIADVESGQPAIVFAKNFPNAKKLVIPGSIGEVPIYSFYYVQNELDVVIPKGITKIADDAFWGSNITSVLIGPDVTEIASGSFVYTTKLKGVIIPDNVTNLADDDYKWGPFNSSGVSYIKIGKGATFLASWFCAQCPNLKSIDIPSNIKLISEHAFFRAEKLETITLHEGLETIKWNAFQLTKSLKTITIPNSVTKIDSYAFEQSGLTNITFGKGLTEIGSSAFQSTSLTQISIPSSVKKIGSQAFEYTKLTEVAIPNGVEELESNVFLHGSDSDATLKKLTIPASIKTIDHQMIKESPVLEEVTFANTGVWTKREFGKYNGTWGYKDTCEQVDVSTTAKVKELMASNSGYLPALGHWNSLAECQ